MKIIHSSERRGAVREWIGQAHYSYNFVEDRFVSALRRAGYDVIPAQTPEAFKNKRAFSDVLGSSPDQLIHLCFRSTENIRILPGAWNIGYFFWEFEVLRDRNLMTESVTSNQVHMLRLLDEIWVSCEFTRDLLFRYGLTNVHIVPPPIWEGAEGRMAFEDAAALLTETPCIPLILTSGAQRELNARLAALGMKPFGAQEVVINRLSGGKGRIFLAVCAPHDLRKNLLNIIEGFQIGVGASRDDLLILKLSVRAGDDFLAITPYDTILPRFSGPAALADPRIVIIAGYLEPSEMTALYSMSDFYVSASHCEGFNLPLLEAMRLGAIGVATRNTAMLDYLEDSNSILIKERSFPSPIPNMAADVARQNFNLAFASRFDVARAIRAAVAADEERRRSLALSGQEMVLNNYSESAVLPLIEQRLSATPTIRKSAYVG